MMDTRVFYIKGKVVECKMFRKGERVKVVDGHLGGEVLGTSNLGQYVDVMWDEDVYTSYKGEIVEPLKLRTVDSIEEELG